MNLGLRLQLVLLLAGLLVVGFVPLYFATTTYARFVLEAEQRKAAVALARSVSAQLLVDRHELPPDELLARLSAQVESSAIHAIALYDVAGRPVLRVGEPELVDLLAQPRASERPEAFDLSTSQGPALQLFSPGPAGGICTVTRVDPVATRASSLSRATLLYMSVGALAVLAFAYFGLTRSVIRPILTLRRGAERVAEGARRLELPRRAPRELAELGRSLATMTAQLRSEEETLRRKVSEVEEKTVALEAAQASLVRSERLATVGRLSAGLAHEIGNPISALMGLCDLLIDDDQSAEERADFLRRMRREIERIDRVLSDLLAYARAGQHAGHPSPEKIARVPDAVQDVITLLTPVTSRGDLRIDVDLPGGLPEVRMTTPELTQVLLNLLMNAVDALDGTGRIELSAGLEGDDVWLRVSDDGPGVPLELATQIFEPFVTTKRVGEGTGLGLAVSRGLVEACDGQLSLETSASGARFVIRLPRADDAARSPAPGGPA